MIHVSVRKLLFFVVVFFCACEPTFDKDELMLIESKAFSSGWYATSLCLRPTLHTQKILPTGWEIAFASANSVWSDAGLGNIVLDDEECPFTFSLVSQKELNDWSGGDETRYGATGFNSFNGFRLDGQIKFRDEIVWSENYVWTNDECRDGSNKSYVANLFAHELGHAYGLGHFKSGVMAVPTPTTCMLRHATEIELTTLCDRLWKAYDERVAFSLSHPGVIFKLDDKPNECKR